MVYFHFKAIVSNLAGVLASLQKPSTEHSLSNHVRIGVVAVLIRNDGNTPALQFITVSSYRVEEKEAQE